ncbi:MAG: HD-GYP domain-containing protein, partial [Nitrospinota bacterium]
MMETRQEIDKIITHLNGAITNARLYTPGHTYVQRHVGLVFRELSQLLRAKTELTFIIVGEDLVYENHTLRSARVQTSKLVKNLSENGIERLSFLVGLLKEELETLITDLALSERSTVHTSDHIILGKVEVADCEDISGSMTEEIQQKLEELTSQRDLTVDEVREMSDKIKHNKKIDPRGLEGIVKEFLKGFVRGMNPLNILASIKSSDEYTFTHVVNVSLLTMAQAEFLGFKDDILYQIGVASVLHDTGKLLISDEIINKPGALTIKE